MAVDGVLRRRGPKILILHSNDIGVGGQIQTSGTNEWSRMRLVKKIGDLFGHQ